jgi:hypothetical protein
MVSWRAGSVAERGGTDPEAEVVRRDIVCMGDLRNVEDSVLNGLSWLNSLRWLALKISISA